MTGYIRLETIDLLLAALLLFVNGGLSLALQLGLAKRLAWRFDRPVSSREL